MISRKRNLALALLLSSSIGGLFAAPAMAQDAAPTTDAQASGSVDEVVVTARRRDEVLKDVPIAVSAFSQTKLDQLGAQTITTLQQTTPNLTLQSARGSNSTLIAFIRGVGQQDPLWGFDPGVGLYVNDVYYARPQAAVLDIFDVHDIEVLRGPQGTLYGRNTIGGAIKYTSGDIGPDPHLTVRGEAGSYGEQNLILTARMPINDKWGVSGGFGTYHHQGYGENLFTGEDNYDKNVTAARATIEFKPVDNLLLRLSGDFVDDRSHAREGHRESSLITPGVYDTFAGATQDNRVETSGTSFLARWDINDALTFKSITAYRQGKTDGAIDFDSLPDPLLDIPAQYRDHQFTQEFQLVFDAERLHGVAGVYYLNANASGAFDTIVQQLIPGLPLTILDAGYVKTKSYAAFADVSYDVTDRLEVSVGGRYTKDEKEGHVLRTTYIGLGSPYFGNSSAIFFKANTDYTNERDFDQFTPKASVSYKLTPELTTYASYGKGFKSGGFDMRGDASAYPATVDGYDPETVDSYELGLKGSLLDHRLNFSADVFYSKYNDQQITTQYPGAAGVASVVDNVGSSTIQGAEFEGSFRLLEELTANVAVGYTDAKFDKYLAFIPGAPTVGGACADDAPSPPIATGCFVDVSNARSFQNTPKWTSYFGFTWNHDLGSAGSIAFTPSASYRSHYQMFELAAPLLDQDSYWLYDASLIWTDAKGVYSVGLYGRNLSNEHYKVGGYSFPGAGFGDSVTSYYGNPRTFTVSLQARF
jgi:iron complex outermembrane receptor protein